jgi:anti-sigma factor RsiW
MVTCRHVIEILMEYLNGEVSSEEKARFEDHLAVCPPCVAYLQTYQETIRMGRLSFCDNPPAEAMPEELVQAVLAARQPRRC